MNLLSILHGMNNIKIVSSKTSIPFLGPTRKWGSFSGGKWPGPILVVPRSKGSLVCWDCRFESSRGLACLSPVSVVCCRVEDYATDRSLVQRSHTECVVSECDRGSSLRRPRPTRAVDPREKNCPDVNLTAYIHLVSRLRRLGDIPLLPHTPP